MWPPLCFRLLKYTLKTQFEYKYWNQNNFQYTNSIGLAPNILGHCLNTRLYCQRLQKRSNQIYPLQPEMNLMCKSLFASYVFRQLRLLCVGFQLRRKGGTNTQIEHIHALNKFERKRIKVIRLKNANLRSREGKIYANCTRTGQTLTRCQKSFLFLKQLLLTDSKNHA